MTKPSVLCHKKQVFQVTILVSVKIRIYGVLLLIHFELKYIHIAKKKKGRLSGDDGMLCTGLTREH